MTVIDFRTTQQVFYGGSEIKEVWYQGQKVWEKVQERVEAIFQAEIPITKMGNTIMMNFGQSAWRDGRPEAIDGKMIRFTTGSISYEYTIQLADAQATTMSLMFTTQPIDLQSGMVYRIEILEDVPTTTQTVEWRAMERTEVIPKPTTREIERLDLYPHESYTVYGNEGQYRITYEAEYINGQPTGNIRNEVKVISVIPNPDRYQKGIKANEVKVESYYMFESVQYRNSIAMFYYRDTSIQFSKVKYIEYKGAKLDVSRFNLQKNSDNVWLTDRERVIVDFLTANGASFENKALYVNSGELYLIVE